MFAAMRNGGWSVVTVLLLALVIATLRYLVQRQWKARSFPTGMSEAIRSGRALRAHAHGSPFVCRAVSSLRACSTRTRSRILAVIGISPCADRSASRQEIALPRNGWAWMDSSCRETRSTTSRLSISPRCPRHPRRWRSRQHHHRPPHLTRPPDSYNPRAARRGSRVGLPIPRLGTRTPETRGVEAGDHDLRMGERAEDADDDDLAGLAAFDLSLGSLWVSRTVTWRPTTARCATPPQQTCTGCAVTGL